MPTVTANLNLMNFDKDKITKDLMQVVMDGMKEGAKLFLKESARVPVRTGFARGGFLNLETALQTRIQRAFSSITKFIKGKSKPKLREFYKGTLKTPENARKFATPINQIFINTGAQVTFNYQINIDYFDMNDYYKNRFTASSPWLSFTYGKAAFQRYIEKITVPTVENYIKLQEIVVA